LIKGGAYVPRNKKAGWVRPNESATGGAAAGVIVVLAALLMVFLVCMLAFAIDVGYLTHTRAELRGAVDAAALAGAGGLSEGGEAARQEVRRLLAVNPISGRALAGEEIEIELGVWDEASRRFSVQPHQPAAVRVSATRQATPLFFARIMGRGQQDVHLDVVACTSTCRGDVP